MDTNNNRERTRIDAKKNLQPQINQPSREAMAGKLQILRR
jgi:hypothetical protein